MRKLLLLLAIVTCSMSFAQIREYNMLSVMQSPGSYEDGFSIGIQFEHRDNILYYGGEVYYFPELNDMDYYHWVGRIGLQMNVISNLFQEPVFTIHSGIRLGGIYREEQPHGLAGLECGMTFFYKQFFIGTDWQIDNKADSKTYSNDSYHTVNSGIIKLGFTF